MTRERPTALNVLGRGWAMHVMPDQRTRSLRYTDGRDNVRKSILILLETQPGERLMRPTFGCGLRKYIMQPNTVARILRWFLLKSRTCTFATGHRATSSIRSTWSEQRTSQRSAAIAALTDH